MTFEYRVQDFLVDTVDGNTLGTYTDKDRADAHALSFGDPLVVVQRREVTEWETIR